LLKFSKSSFPLFIQPKIQVILYETRSVLLYNGRGRVSSISSGEREEEDLYLARFYWQSSLIYRGTILLKQLRKTKFKTAAQVQNMELCWI